MSNNHPPAHRALLDSLKASASRGDTSEALHILAECRSPVFEAHLMNCAGACALHEAARHKRLETCSALLGAGVEVDARDDFMVTALMVASTSREDNHDVIRLLIDAGADINAFSVNKVTPLLNACRHGVRENIQCLLDAGPDLHFADVGMVLPQHLLASQGLTEELIRVAAMGADMQACDREGATPMHYAVFHKKGASVQQLVDLGACIETPNKNGLKPLDVALKKNSEQAFLTLLAAGANSKGLPADKLCVNSPVTLSRLQASIELGSPRLIEAAIEHDRWPATLGARLSQDCERAEQHGKEQARQGALIARSVWASHLARQAIDEMHLPSGPRELGTYRPSGQRGVG